MEANIDSRLLTCFFFVRLALSKVNASVFLFINWALFSLLDIIVILGCRGDEELWYKGLLISELSGSPFIFMWFISYAIRFLIAVVYVLWWNVLLLLNLYKVPIDLSSLSNQDGDGWFLLFLSTLDCCYGMASKALFDLHEFNSRWSTYQLW